MKGPCGNPVSRGLHRCDGPENTKMEGGVPDNGRTLCAETSWKQRLCARERPRKAYGMEPLRRDVMETADVRTGKASEAFIQCGRRQNMNLNEPLMGKLLHAAAQSGEKIPDVFEGKMYMPLDRADGDVKRFGYFPG